MPAAVWRGTTPPPTSDGFLPAQRCQPNAHHRPRCTDGQRVPRRRLYRPRSARYDVLGRGRRGLLSLLGDLRRDPDDPFHLLYGRVPRNQRSPRRSSPADFAALAGVRCWSWFAAAARLNTTRDRHRRRPRRLRCWRRSPANRTWCSCIPGGDTYRRSRSCAADALVMGLVSHATDLPAGGLATSLEGCAWLRQTASEFNAGFQRANVSAIGVADARARARQQRRLVFGSSRATRIRTLLDANVVGRFAHGATVADR
jgi:hypothetical protein